MRPKEISIQNIQFLFVLYDNINLLLATFFLLSNRDGEKSPQQQPVALYGLFKKRLAKTDLVSIDRQTGPRSVVRSHHGFHTKLDMSSQARTFRETDLQ